MSSRSTLEFLKTETGSGLLLAASALLAILWANSPGSGAYFALIDHSIAVRLGPFGEEMSLGGWVKTALMPVFFFIVGLEIKQEVVRGELSNPRRLALPILAALGGVAVPALIYLAFNAGQTGHPQGWPTPVATDIAFALAALAMVAPRLPPPLRVFLLTLAIADDLVAVALIALVFSHDVRPWMLGGALATVGVLAAMSRWRSAPYVFWTIGFILLWGFTLKSGVNTSIAGVAAAMCIPLQSKKPGRPGVLDEVMEALHPYVAFFILPLFAFTAAGFAIGGLPAGAITGPVALGVGLGLFLGKQVGVFGAAALAIGLKLARRPTGAKWLELYGVSVLCGIGFTMSLYIGALAFPAGPEQAEVRLGVVSGSLASTLWGMAVLGWAQARRSREPG
ncbi:MAG: Na+/H+ antiporter NhaA [Phenylobacterium sp.]